MPESGPTLIAIHLAARKGEPTSPVERVEAVAGAGLRGDRCFAPGADPGRQLSLVEAEALQRLATVHGIELTPGESRRQLTTRGVRLNALVGRRFLVGDVECRGIELCEPCTRLQTLTGKPGLVAALAHRGGLYAEILSDGEIAVGAPIVVLD